MICPKCNYRGAEGHKWCPKCGSPMQEQADVGSDSLEKKLHMNAENRKQATKKAVLEIAEREKLKKDLRGTGIGLLCMSLLHFAGILWSFMFAFSNEDGMELLSQEIAEGSYGEIGRTIVYNSGDSLRTSNPTLTWIEVMMGIALITVALICFAQTSNWPSNRKTYYYTVPATLFWTYLGYTLGLIYAYSQIESGSFYEELFGFAYVLYIVAAIIMTIVALSSYSKKKADLEYLIAKANAPATVTMPKYEYATIPNTPPVNSGASQTVRPTEVDGMLKCPACGEDGQPVNRTCCWQCGAKFIK